MTVIDNVLTRLTAYWTHRWRREKKKKRSDLIKVSIIN